MKKNYKPPYSQWNYTTACCYKHKMICANCPNEIVCSKVTYTIEGMHPYKYAALQTFKNIGLKGYKRAFVQKVFAGGYDESRRDLLQ